MIALEKIADLELSAASAILWDGPHLLVVADDELHLDRYSAATGRRVDRLALLERPLPLEAAARKAAKPDFEALAWLPGARVLVLGSGSTERRQSGVLLLPPDGIDGAPREPREVDLAPLYGALRERFPALNVEGAAVAGDALRLLNRGGAGRDNGVIELDLAAVLRALDRGEPLSGELVRAVHRVELGVLDGVPLGFTDASPFGSKTGQLAFAAAAEDTENPYDDGPCAGSVVGVLEADGRVSFLERLAGHHKIEGLAIADGPHADGAGRAAFLVADPDDSTQRAPLFRASLPAW